MVGLARILNRHDVANMTFDSGIEVDRRENRHRNVSWGVWLFPIDSSMKANELHLDHGLPAITQDLRREGIGVMTPMRLDGDQFVIAMPETAVLDTFAPETSSRETVWNFFRCDVRHNTRSPGGWYHLGLQVAEAVELDGGQRNDFREHVASIGLEADV